MNIELENILKKGIIETYEEAELFWDKAHIDIYRKYKHRERIHARLRLFETREYYALISYLTYERTSSSLINQHLEFYWPDGKVATYEELVEMKRIKDSTRYLSNKYHSVYGCILRGTIETEELAKWFLMYADNIYSTETASINVRINLFKTEDFYCEISGKKIFNEEKKELEFVVEPGPIKYYSPDGEEESFCALIEKNSVGKNL